MEYLAGIVLVMPAAVGGYLLKNSAILWQKIAAAAFGFGRINYVKACRRLSGSKNCGKYSEFAFDSVFGAAGSWAGGCFKFYFGMKNSISIG